MKLFRIFGRSIRDAFKSVNRNFSLTIASVSCISITLIIVSFSLIMSYNVKNFSKEIKADVTIFAYLNEDTTSKRANEILSELTALDNIDGTPKFISKEQAKEDFKNYDERYEDLVEGWGDDNYLLDYYLIKVEDITKIKDTVLEIKKIEEMHMVSYGEGMVERLVSGFELAEKIMLCVVLVLLVVTIFLIINTIKLTIFSRKREISIMRLVGASNFTIKNPFVIEGMIIGCLGSIIPIIITIYGYIALYDHLEGKIFTDVIKLVSPEPFVYYISIIILVLGMIVGMLGSARAVRKYLKV